MTERMDDRALRLKTLGNAVCPPQAYPIFRYIAMIENGTCGDFCPYGKRGKRHLSVAGVAWEMICADRFPSFFAGSKADGFKVERKPSDATGVR